jgi:Skp family chaperone for outer membrane proteins
MAIFAKNSIQAALAQERLDKSVEQSLRSINQLDQLPSVNSFISGIEKASNITKDRLTPAINGLIIQTADLTKAQDLFNVAVDTSVGAGVDLTQVSDALGKASRGNFKALGALGLGFDAVTAKEIGLAEITDYLTLKFGGAAKRATETFGGQLDALKISAGAAQTSLGEGFITATEILIGGGNASDYFGSRLESLGLNGGYILIALADKAQKITNAFDSLGKKIEGNRFLRLIFDSSNIPIIPGLIAGFGMLADEGKKIAETTKETFEQSKEQKALAEKLAKLQARLDKMAAEALNKQKKITKEKLAQQALDKKKAELEAMFDLDRINLQAALSRKLSAEDELRVKILQKLADGTKKAVDEAERYADVLKVIEDGQITTGEIEMLAKKWGVTTTEVLIYLRTLFAANDELRKMLALLDEIGKKKMPVGMTFQYQQQQFQQITSPRFQESVLTGEAPNVLGQQVFEDLRKEGLNAAMAGSSARYTAQAVDYYQRLFDIPRMAEGGIVNQPTLALIGEAGSEAVIPLDKMGGMGTTVNINVAGSVISEGELQSVIQDALYNLNRSGAVTQLTNLGR